MFEFVDDLELKELFDDLFKNPLHLLGGMFLVGLVLIFQIFCAILMDVM